MVKFRKKKVSKKKKLHETQKKKKLHETQKKGKKHKENKKRKKEHKRKRTRRPVRVMKPTPHKMLIEGDRKPGINITNKMADRSTIYVKSSSGLPSREAIEIRYGGKGGIMRGSDYMEEGRKPRQPIKVYKNKQMADKNHGPLLEIVPHSKITKITINALNNNGNAHVAVTNKTVSGSNIYIKGESGKPSKEGVEIKYGAKGGILRGSDNMKEGRKARPPIRVYKNKQMGDSDRDPLLELVPHTKVTKITINEIT
mgnify:CR=1 FL=1|tara:strand:- start:4907 stop:5671 length:765 start_codon:yes stop_codon:yes gene_type:complete